MNQPLMPKATCVWLIDNTGLTFEQIGAFCHMHALEVQAVADGEVAVGIIGRDPIAAGELTQQEITRCESDPSGRLKMAKSVVPRAAERTKGPRYTAMAKRQDKPDGIAWLVRNHPELSDAQVGKLLGTTKNTIAAVRDRTHWNSSNIKPRHPVDLGLCTYLELNAAVESARAKLTPEEREAIEQREQEPLEEEKPAANTTPSIAELFGRMGGGDTAD
ncbi:MAG: DUF1013 domain-containing protein [Alphaproteobacteria bacterium]|nr:DUF1013 domain-containing protein [Alphaproteobacteria bacterium]MCB9930399.1 DUF1013 domain-containing protein [Alphaproteobacteria bacterium]